MSTPAVRQAELAPTFRGGENAVAEEVWRLMQPLHEPGAYQQAFREVVPITPLVQLEPYALPADLRKEKHTVLLKHDGRMPSGAYKIGGFTHALLATLVEHPAFSHIPAVGNPSETDVVVASTGNHANAAATTAHMLGFRSVTAYCPEDASLAKLYNIRSNGAVVRLRPTLTMALDAAEAHGKRTDAVFIHPYNYFPVIAGQGRSMLEALDQVGQGQDGRDTVAFYPVGGGGNIAGASVAGHHLLPHMVFRGVQAEGAHGAAAALSNETISDAAFDGRCDGAAVRVPGSLPMEIIGDSRYVQEIDVVSMGAIGEAMAVASNRIEIPEPAGALALAGALRYMREHRGGNKTLIVHVSGINKTPDTVREFMEEALAEDRLTHQDVARVITRAELERPIFGLDELLMRQTISGPQARALTVLSGTFPRS